MPAKNTKQNQTAKTKLSQVKHWTFLSNHAHVAVCLAQNPDSRVRDMADAVGITERAVQKILVDLEDAAVIKKVKRGRRNTYSINRKLPLRHPLEAHRSIGDFLAMVTG